MTQSNVVAQCESQFQDRFFLQEPCPVMAGAATSERAAAVLAKAPGAARLSLSERLMSVAASTTPSPGLCLATYSHPGTCLLSSGSPALITSPNESTSRPGFCLVTCSCPGKHFLTTRMLYYFYYYTNAFLLLVFLHKCSTIVSITTRMLYYC